MLLPGLSYILYEGVTFIMKKVYKMTALLLAAALSLTEASAVSAAKKATLSSKKMNVEVGAKKKIKIKKKSKGAVYTFKSASKKTAAVNKKGVVTGKKAGKTKITVKERIGKKTRKIGKVTVKVYEVKESDTNVTPVPVQTDASIQATEAPAAEPTAAPTEEPTIAPTRAPLVLDDTSTPSGFNQKQSGVAYGQLSRVTYYSTTVGKERAMNVITPPEYDPNKAYPVLYLCHGGNGDEGDWIGGSPEIILGNLIAKDEAKPMIMVLVNCRARMNDGANPSDSLSLEHMAAWTNFLFELQDDVMPFMEENYNILTGRENTGIAGLSMGGRESLYIGFKIPEKIAYIGAFSPAFGIFEYENWGLYETGYFTEEEFTYPEEYMQNTTCMIMNGTNDSMVRDEPERYHNALVENGVNHYYYTIPGDHNMDVWANGLYHFLKVAFNE